MDIEIPTTLSLNRIQTIAAIILSILGVGYFVFLSAVVRIRSLYRIKNDGSIPVLETVVPTSLMDIFNILRIKMLNLTMIVCLLVVFGLTLTSFEGVIVLNTLSYIKSCETTVVT